MALKHGNGGTTITLTFDIPHAHHRRERHVLLVPEDAHLRVHVAPTHNVKLDVLEPHLHKRPTARSPLDVEHLGFPSPGLRQELPGGGVPDACEGSENISIDL